MEHKNLKSMSRNARVCNLTLPVREDKEGWGLRTPAGFVSPARREDKVTRSRAPFRDPSRPVSRNVPLRYCFVSLGDHVVKLKPPRIIARAC